MRERQKKRSVSIVAFWSFFHITELSVAMWRPFSYIFHSKKQFRFMDFGPLYHATSHQWLNRSGIKGKKEINPRTYNLSNDRVFHRTFRSQSPDIWQPEASHTDWTAPWCERSGVYTIHHQGGWGLESSARVTKRKYLTREIQNKSDEFF